MEVAPGLVGIARPVADRNPRERWNLALGRRVRQQLVRRSCPGAFRGAADQHGACRHDRGTPGGYTGCHVRGALKRPCPRYDSAIMTNQAELYERFRALHDRNGGFIMPNAWDGTSALVLKQAGFQALG